MIRLFKRCAIITAAALLLVGGVIGLLLPILPGVVLLLASAALLHYECPALDRHLVKFQEHIRKSLMRVRVWLDNRPARRGAKAEIQTATDEKSRLYSRPKVLVFEQNIQDLARVASVFESQDFDVCKCASLDSAMRCIEQEEFDFALVDQGTLDFEGRRVIRHLKRYNFPISFLVLTGAWNDQCHQQAMELGATDYLEIPVTQADFHELLSSYFVKQNGIQDEIGNQFQVASPTDNAG